MRTEQDYQAIWDALFAAKYAGGDVTVTLAMRFADKVIAALRSIEKPEPKPSPVTDEVDARFDSPPEPLGELPSEYEIKYRAANQGGEPGYTLGFEEGAMHLRSLAAPIISRLREENGNLRVKLGEEQQERVIRTEWVEGKGLVNVLLTVSDYRELKEENEKLKKREQGMIDELEKLRVDSEAADYYVKRLDAMSEEVDRLTAALSEAKTPDLWALPMTGHKTKYTEDKAVARKWRSQGYALDSYVISQDSMRGR